MSSDNISIGTVNASGGQNNVGKNEIAGDQIQNNNFSGLAPTVTEVMKAVEDAVPDEVKEDTIQPLMAMAELPLEIQSESEKKEEAKNLWARLTPYRGAIIKGCAAFSETAITAIAATNPILLGLVALIKAVKPKDE